MSTAMAGMQAQREVTVKLSISSQISVLMRNYKATSDYVAKIAELCPNSVNAYFDNDRWCTNRFGVS